MVPLPQMVLSWPRIIVILVGGTNTYTTESATKQEIQLRMKRIHSTTEATRFCKSLARIISVRAGLPGACENIPNKLGFKMAGQKNLRKMKPTTISSDTVYKYVQLTAVIHLPEGIVPPRGGMHTYYEIQVAINVPLLFWHHTQHARKKIDATFTAARSS